MTLPSSPRVRRALVVAAGVWLLLGIVLLTQRVMHRADLITTDRASSIPVRLTIPAINVDAPITPVGLTPNDAMDVPADPNVVGWFAYGFLPGFTGSSVLSGHLDTERGTKAVFGELHKLKKNDVVAIQTKDGDTLHFRVIDVRAYPYNDAPIEEIFGSTKGKFLNLITCHGSWNTQTYEERLVIYTQFDETIN